MKKAELALYHVAFDEGASCTLHTFETDWKVNEVTWDYAKKDTKWPAKSELNLISKSGAPLSGGGDYDPNNGVAFNGAGFNAWETIDVTDMIAEMVDGKRKNYGFLLRTFYENSLGRKYNSSEATEKDNRPKLTVEYEAVGIINGILSVNNKFINFKIYDKRVNVSIKKPGTYNLTINTLSGRSISKVEFNGNRNFILETAGLSRGVFIFHITGIGINFKRSIIIQ